jgi:uncharacterized membrane protein YkoI
MTIRTAPARIAGLLLAAFLGLAVASAPAAAACLSAEEARDAVAAGEARRLGSVARSVPGDILDAQLCESGGQLVYRLTVMVEEGRVVTIVVDAQSGRQLN